MSESSADEAIPTEVRGADMLPGLAAVPEVRSLLEAVDLSIGRWDTEGRLTFFNPPHDLGPPRASTAGWSRRNTSARTGSRCASSIWTDSSRSTTVWAMDAAKQEGKNRWALCHRRIDGGSAPAPDILTPF